MGLGAASSSCSYAAVALARSIFRKGANFSASMVFELASTNLVIELGIIIIVLMGWQFALAEFVGAPVMVAILVMFFRMFLKPEMVSEARAQAEKGLHGKMEGHAEMDMAVTEGPILKRILSEKGRTAISHYFVMDWLAVWKDIAGGLLIAGAIAAFVPTDFWKSSGRRHKQCEHAGDACRAADRCANSRTGHGAEVSSSRNPDRRRRRRQHESHSQEHHFPSQLLQRCANQRYDR